MSKTYIDALRACHTIQGWEGNWDCSNYMTGFYNGLELALAFAEEREPVFRAFDRSLRGRLKRLERALQLKIGGVIG
jgi:hypothetical protein